MVKGMETLGTTKESRINFTYLMFFEKIELRNRKNVKGRRRDCKIIQLVIQPEHLYRNELKEIVKLQLKGLTKEEIRENSIRRKYISVS